MKKSMYSLMLLDDIVAEVDHLAYQNGTNRSNLINQILAEYLSIKTPEMHIKEIFDNMARQIEEIRDFKLSALPSDYMLSIKSPLAYKHRPTVKYSVEIYRADSTYMGQLRALFRTQHQDLLGRLTLFFQQWTELERHYVQPYFKDTILYQLEEGKFSRSLMLPRGKAFDSDTLGNAAVQYIKAFDDCLKLYLDNPQLTASGLEQRYLEYCNSGLPLL